MHSDICRATLKGLVHGCWNSQDCPDGTTLERLLFVDFHALSYRNGPSGAETLAGGGAVVHCTNSPTCF